MVDGRGTVTVSAPLAGTRTRYSCVCGAVRVPLWSSASIFHMAPPARGTRGSRPRRPACRCSRPAPPRARGSSSRARRRCSSPALRSPVTSASPASLIRTAPALERRSSSLTHLEPLALAPEQPRPASGSGACDGTASSSASSAVPPVLALYSVQSLPAASLYPDEDPPSARARDEGGASPPPAPGRARPARRRPRRAARGWHRGGARRGCAAPGLPPTTAAAGVVPPLARVSSARSNVAPVAFFTVAHAEEVDRARGLVEDREVVGRPREPGGAVGELERVLARLLAGWRHHEARLQAGAGRQPHVLDGVAAQDREPPLVDGAGLDDERLCSSAARSTPATSPLRGHHRHGIADGGAPVLGRRGRAGDEPLLGDGRGRLGQVAELHRGGSIVAATPPRRTSPPAELDLAPLRGSARPRRARRTSRRRASACGADPQMVIRVGAGPAGARRLASESAARMAVRAAFELWAGIRSPAESAASDCSIAAHRCASDLLDTCL